MYDFNKYLDEDETILSQGKAVPGKGHKNIAGGVFLVVFSGIVMLIMMLSLVYKIGDGAEGINISFVIIFAVALLFFGIGIYILIYDLILKKRQVSDDIFCLTDKRLFKYETKNDKLIYGYLAYFEKISCENVKDGYGDIHFSIEYERVRYKSETSIKLANLITNPNPQNMPVIVLESISKPYEIKKMAMEARKKILEENDFNINDMF